MTKRNGNDALIAWFDEAGANQLARVGGKNASLVEMTRALAPSGVRVPTGFAVTAEAYRRFVHENGLERALRDELAALASGAKPLHVVGAAIRLAFRNGTVPQDIERSVVSAYHELCRREGIADAPVAVRSSATAEDLPEASFAGQQETFLNVAGDGALIEAYRQCLASLFTDRAIAYRDEHHLEHVSVALSVGVQRMVRSDLACSGVMFTLDPETGFPDVVVINASWGLGENVVKGTVVPDELIVFKKPLDDASKRPLIGKRRGEKERTLVLARGGQATTRNVETPLHKRRRFCLADDEALALARMAVVIERHASTPMDIEWAKDGLTGQLYIVQARPETVQARKTSGGLVRYSLVEEGPVLVRGTSVGDAIATGPVRILKSVEDIAAFPAGSILVAETTDPDWVPAMRTAKGIITEHGGRTCHAAIVSRELGIPAIVGAAHATEVLKDGASITMSCAGGEHGVVYDGALAFRREEVPLAQIPATKTKVMINLADPTSALSWWRLPTDGVGLARIEFIIAEHVRVHPMALVRFDEVKDPRERAAIEELTRGYGTKGDYFVDELARGIATLAASQHPRPVIVRMSDFKTNEYASLLGGKAFEPVEENPMIGFRGASRYADPRYRPGFALECRAISRVRDEMGLDNVIVMIPFCRTIDEADRVLAVMAAEGLRRGERGLLVYVMCEIPANVILAEDFAARFDGFSIGSNDLTQLTLGVDRDSELLAPLFDERNAAVTRLIEDVIVRAHAAGTPVGICGQAPSDYPEFAGFLVRAGIDSISLNPDRFVATKLRIAEAEALLASSS